MPTNPRAANSIAIRSLTVAVPGTPLQLPQYFLADGEGATLTPRPTNAGNFYLGTSSANATDTTKRQLLVPGEPIDLPVDSTDRLWVDADFSTDYITLKVFQHA